MAKNTLANKKDLIKTVTPLLLRVSQGLKIKTHLVVIHTPHVYFAVKITMLPVHVGTNYVPTNKSTQKANKFVFS